MTYLPMRRKDRQLDLHAAAELLERGEYGVLTTVDTEGQPYGVPVSYAYDGEALYIHSAQVGHKLDNLRANPRVSFTVVGRTQVLPEQFSTVYESAIVFGLAALVEGEQKARGLRLLAEKYNPGQPTQAQAYIEKLGQATQVIRVQVTYLSGKARPALG